MALGVSSYSVGGGRRRHREPGPYGPKHPVWNLLARLESLLARVWPLVRVPLSLLAVAHLVLVAAFPGGRNLLFGITAKEAPAYPSLFQVPDTLGFYTADGADGFIVYKIYTQDGGVVNGVFPDTKVAPRLRYDRWAMVGNAATGPYPALHRFVVDYVLHQLPSPPVRLELFAAHWTWNHNGLTFPLPATGPHTTLHLERLGSYNGLTRTWVPASPGDKRK